MNFLTSSLLRTHCSNQVVLLKELSMNSASLTQPLATPHRLPLAKKGKKTGISELMHL